MKKLLILAVIALLSAACTVNQISVQDARNAHASSAAAQGDKPVYRVTKLKLTYWFFWASTTVEGNMLCTGNDQGDLDCKK